MSVVNAFQLGMLVHRRNDNGVINHALHNENYSPSLGDLFPLIMVYLSKLVSFFSLLARSKAFGTLQVRYVNKHKTVVEFKNEFLLSIFESASKNV